MVDLQNPTSQFHSYQPPDAKPHTDNGSGRWEVLRKVGLTDSQIESVRSGMSNLDVPGNLNKARDYARRNPGIVLGGMAALVIGAGLLMRKGHKTPGREVPKY